MARRGLPEHVERFLAERIRSLAELEVLLLLHREPTRWWTAESVNNELRTSLHSASLCLKHLRAMHLLDQSVEPVASYRFFPSAHVETAIIGELAELFKTRLSSILDAIYNAKRDSLRDFAEAFRIKKGSDGDG